MKMRNVLTALTCAVMITMSAVSGLRAEETEDTGVMIPPPAAAMPSAAPAPIPFDQPLRLAVVAFETLDGAATPATASREAEVKALTARGARIADAAATASLQAVKAADLKQGALPAGFTSAAADYVIMLETTVTVGAKNVRGSDKNSYGVDVVTTVIHTDTAKALNALTLKGGGVFANPAEAAAEAIAKRSGESANYVATILNRQKGRDFQIRLHITGVQDTDHRDDLLDILAFPPEIREVRFQKLAEPYEASDILLTVQGISAGAVARILDRHGFGLKIDKVGRGELWATYAPQKAFALKLFTTAFANATGDDGYEAAADKLAASFRDHLNTLPWIWTAPWPDGTPDFPKGRALKKLLKNTHEDFGRVLMATGELRIRRDIMKLTLKIYMVPTAKPLLSVTLEGDFSRPESFAAQMQQKVSAPLWAKIKKMRKRFSRRKQAELQKYTETAKP